MVIFMKYTPKPKNTVATVIVFGFIITSTALYYIARFDIEYRIIPQLIAFILVIVALYIAIRYKFTTFIHVVSSLDGDIPSIYELSSGDIEKLEFTVFRTQGARKPIAQCRFSLSELISVEILSEDGVNKVAGELEMYRYISTFMPKTSCLAVFKGERGRNIGILFDASDEMTEYLIRAAKVNKI